jgi:MFS superfamily sulfate permease-like transporter
MEVVLEQFISSDRPKRISNMFKSISIVFGIVAIMIVFGSMIIGIALGIVCLGLYLVSYLMYIDYEYELYNGDITVTKVYNASRRKVAQKINRDQVKRVYLTERKDALKKGVTAYYNTNLEGLNIYTFELNNNKVVQVALNEELEKIVKIIYVQSMTY